MRRPLFCVVLMALLPLTSLAADPLPPPPPMPPPAEMPPPPPPPPLDAPAAECIPACRSGYQCIAGACVTVCTPPCGPGQSCTADGRCAEGTAPGTGVMVNDAGERAPPGQHFETKRRVGMLITGPILFGAGYLLGAGYGFLSFAGTGATVRLLNFIPLAGPAISQLVLMTGPGISSTLFNDVVFTLIVTALQVTGLTLAILGIPKRQVLVDDDREPARPGREREPARDSQLPPIQWSIAPFAPGADVGISLLVRN